MWALRIVWIILPVAAGPAVGDALSGWARAPRVVAEIMLWAGWAAVLVSLLAPRPLGLTVTRIVGPAFVAVAIATAWRAPALSAASAIATTSIAAFLTTRSAFARASAEGVAYGDELRFPLKVPPALAVGAGPVAVLLVAAGIATGPLLIASGHIAAGVVATLIGFPLAAFLFRALHGLSMRWAVLVPAGVTIVDPMTLADPVLFMRERIAGLDPVGIRAADGVLDLRLGASVGAIALHLTDDAQIVTAGRGRSRSEKVTTRTLVFAPVDAATLLVAVSRRVGQREVT
jgi:hypothetical protein